MSIKEFDVKSSEDISAYVVTNEDYSVALSSESQAFMVCNMINRLVRYVNEENKLLNEELEQCRAVIENRWSEYLEKKGDVE